MNLMLSPDLLDRRAIALIRLVDIFGLPVEGNVDISGPGLRYVRKSGGRIAIIAAENFDAYEASFTEPPPAPAVGSRNVKLELTPTDPKYAARSYTLKLPRDPDPDNREQPQSLFAAEDITLLPGAALSGTSSSFVMRALVTRKSDGAIIENAIVRGASNDNKFTAVATTNHRGEATLVFPEIPPSFTGNGASVERSIDGKVIVDADPATALFHKTTDLAAAALAASKRKSGHADPDLLAAAHAANFAAGVPVKIAAGQSGSLQMKWTSP